MRANFEEGCFDITFDLIQLYQDVRDLIKTEGVSDAKELLEWIGLIAGAIGVGGLLRFLKWKRGRPIKSVEQQTSTEKGITYNIAIEGDHNTVEISSEVYKLFRSPRVRLAQRGVVDPLREEGIEVVEVRENGKVITQLTKDEYKVGSFELIESEVEEEKLEPQIFEAVLVIRSPVFVEGAKWQFWLGQTRISASLLDPKFNNQVFQQGERFGVGDHLRVKLSMTQVITPRGGYRNDYEILRVIEFKRGPKQGDLPLDDEGDSGDG